MHGNKGDLNIVGKVYVTTYRLGGMSFLCQYHLIILKKKKRGTC